MEVAFSLVLGFVLCGLLFHFYLPTGEIETVFSPEDGDKIIRLIDSAQESIDIEVYVFTSRDVVEALERARNRGVEIRIIMEERVISGQNNQMYDELTAKGFAVKYASYAYDLTHSKFIIIDSKTVFVGSHNFSYSALYENREASVILHSEQVADEFEKVFESDWIIGV
jgi:phosphatidylserine/phosphatidylglycerophosphate/cardiolipin synthase-like enzyme